MEQLFLIEILVETISFNVADPVPQKKQIYISARFGMFANLEIRHDGIATGDETTKSADIEYATGKSYLFPCEAQALLEALKNEPLELTVGTKKKPLIGKASFKWTEEFISMLESCGESVGYITPTSVRDVFPLVGSNGAVTGHIDAFVRLSCFGKSIQTQFQIVPNKDAKDGAPKSLYLFKSTNAATTFQCERYGLGTSADIIPVGPVYNPIEFEDLRGLRAVFQATSQSVCESIIPSVFELELDANANPNGNYCANGDALGVRPPDGRFIKLDDLQGAAAGGGGRKKKTYTDEDLTPENINRLLCKHVNCPAAKKFKEFGLGPLATGKGLGTVYGTVEPPTTYGLSHAHGTMERYGPYGVYYRPKRVDQEFVPKPEDSSSDPPLRLTGGAPVEEGGAPSPLQACKDLMADFDKILVAYKKALGPCGHATCPFSENLIAESCKIICPGKDDAPHELPLTPMEMVARSKATADDDGVSTCGIPSCPYTRKMTQPVEEEFKLGQIKSACGDPTCPYVKRRCGLDDEDADEATVQLARLPETCGAAKCPYAPPPPTLPPIHWDCPDPLPKGACKNPNCPIGKREQLAAFIFRPPVAPCRKNACPYKIPPPCNFSGCPFGPPLACNVPGCPYSRPPACTDPNCPLSSLRGKKSGDTLCRDATCKNLREEEKAEEAGPIEVCSGDTMEPCTPHTCNAKGGVLECAVCGGRSGKTKKVVCPCTRKSRKAEEVEGVATEGAIEVCSGDTMEPCTPHTCNAKGGVLECAVCKGRGDARESRKVCPCAGKPPRKEKADEVEGEATEGAIEVCSGDTMEPCTPHTCKAKEGGTLKCAVCKLERVCPCSKKGRRVEEGGAGEGGVIEVCSGDTMEPCTPHTCASKQGKLKCAVCGGDKGAEGEDDDDDDDEDELGGDRPVEYVCGDTVEPCTPNTCAGKGGDLICAECGRKATPCPCTSPHVCVEAGAKKRGPIAKKQKLSKVVITSLVRGAPPKRAQWSAERKALKTICKARKTAFVYDTGDTYPGIKIGHRECVTPRSNVPHNMGWLWNIKPQGRLKPRRGWKPGALTKTMAATIINHRLKSGIKPLVAPPVGQKPAKKRKVNAYGVFESDSDDETIAPKPTLQIKKKDGCYMITMNPLKDPFSLEDNENPYMDCTPLQFRIAKKPPSPAKEEDEEEEEDGEESSCYCADDRSSSESELDIEFTPPAGILRPERLKRKKNVVHTDTQYCPGDFSEKVETTLQLEKKEPKMEGKKGGKKGGKKKKKKKKK